MCSGLCFSVREEGFEVVYLEVDHLGFVDLNELRDAQMSKLSGFYQGC